MHEKYTHTLASTRVHWPNGILSMTKRKQVGRTIHYLMRSTYVAAVSSPVAFVSVVFFSTYCVCVCVRLFSAFNSFIEIRWFLIHWTGFFPSTFWTFFMIMSFIWWFLSQRHKYTQTPVIRISRKRVLRVREFCGAVCISEIWFVLTPMLENLLMFQVTSENMTGIRLFKLTATHSRTLNVCDCDCKVKQSKSKNQKKTRKKIGKNK